MPSQKTTFPSRGSPSRERAIVRTNSRVPSAAVAVWANMSLLIHTTRLLSLSEDLPVAVIIVDQEDRIRGFLPKLDELVTEGLVIIDPVEVIRYVGRGQETAS